MAVTKGYTCWLTYYQIAQLIPTEEQRAWYWYALNEYLFADRDMEGELEPFTAMAFIMAKAHAKTSLKNSDNGKAKAKPNKSQSKAKTQPNKSQTKAKRQPNDSQIATSSRLRQILNNTDGAAVLETAPPVCPNCGSAGEWNESMSWWECPECVARLA